MHPVAGTIRALTYLEFQSLLGFLMRCDTFRDSGFVALNEVSIPAGFSDALRHDEAEPHGYASDWFQSLLGFLMRCDRPC